MFHGLRSGFRGFHPYGWGGRPVAFGLGGWAFAPYVNPFYSPISYGPRDDGSDQDLRMQAGADPASAPSQEAAAPQADNSQLRVQPERPEQPVSAHDATNGNTLWMQQMLHTLGYNLGPFRDVNNPSAGMDGMDGLWGKYTEAALRQFQTEHGLEPTGMLDADTMNALEQSAQRQAASQQDGYSQGMGYAPLIGPGANISRPYNRPPMPGYPQRHSRDNLGPDDPSNPWHLAGHPPMAPSTFSPGGGEQGPQISGSLSDWENRYRQELVHNVEAEKGNSNVDGKYGPDRFHVWCAEFNEYLRDKTAKEFGISVSSAIGNAWVPTVRTQAERLGAFETDFSKAQPGDSAIVGGGHHIFTILKVEGNTVYGIGGNAGAFGPQGRAVREQHFSINQLDGYINEGKIARLAMAGKYHNDAELQRPSPTPHHPRIREHVQGQG